MIAVGILVVSGGLFLWNIIGTKAISAIIPPTKNT